MPVNLATTVPGVAGRVEAAQRVARRGVRFEYVASVDRTVPLLLSTWALRVWSGRGGGRLGRVHVEVTNLRVAAQPDGMATDWESVSVVAEP